MSIFVFRELLVEFKVKLTQFYPPHIYFKLKGVIVFEAGLIGQ